MKRVLILHLLITKTVLGQTVSVPIKCEAPDCYLYRGHVLLNSQTGSGVDDVDIKIDDTAGEPTVMGSFTFRLPKMPGQRAKVDAQKNGYSIVNREISKQILPKNDPIYIIVSESKNVQQFRLYYYEKIAEMAITNSLHDKDMRIKKLEKQFVENIGLHKSNDSLTTKLSELQQSYDNQKLQSQTQKIQFANILALTDWATSTTDFDSAYSYIKKGQFDALKYLFPTLNMLVEKDEFIKRSQQLRDINNDFIEKQKKSAGLYKLLATAALSDGDWERAFTATENAVLFDSTRIASNQLVVKPDTLFLIPYIKRISTLYNWRTMLTGSLPGRRDPPKYSAGDLSKIATKSVILTKQLWKYLLREYPDKFTAEYLKILDVYADFHLYQNQVSLYLAETQEADSIFRVEAKKRLNKFELLYARFLYKNYVNAGSKNKEEDAQLRNNVFNLVRSSIKNSPKTAFNLWENVATIDLLILEDIRHRDPMRRDTYGSTPALLKEQIFNYEFFIKELKKYKKNKSAQAILAREYSDLSWLYLSTKQFKAATKAAKMGIKLDTNINGKKLYDLENRLRTYLAHSYWLRKKYKKAEELYRMVKDYPDWGGQTPWEKPTWKPYIIRDLHLLNDLQGILISNREYLFQLLGENTEVWDREKMR